jgi:hypothetical protein
MGFGIVRIVDVRKVSPLGDEKVLLEINRNAVLVVNSGIDIEDHDP